MNKEEICSEAHARLGEYFDSYVLLGITVDGTPVARVAVADEKSRARLNAMLLNAALAELPAEGIPNGR